MVDVQGCELRAAVSVEALAIGSPDREHGLAVPWPCSTLELSVEDPQDLRRRAPTPPVLEVPNLRSPRTKLRGSNQMRPTERRGIEMSGLRAPCKREQKGSRHYGDEASDGYSFRWG